MKKRKGTFYKKDIKERKKKKKERSLQNKKDNKIRLPKNFTISGYREQKKQAAAEKLQKEVQKLTTIHKKIKYAKKYKNTKFLLDTNTIFDRKIYKDNILQLLKGSGNKILLSTLVVEETRKREKTTTQKSIIDELGDLFGDRVEHTVITNEMKKKGKELEKKHESLGLHYPDSYILAQAIMIKGVIITADQFLIDSCNAEDVDVYDQREYIQKKPKMKKKKAIKPQKKYSINYIKKLLSDDHQP